MRHPEALIVPLMLLADYYLTIWGAKLAEQGYRSHFKSPSYELNPVWRGDVAKKRLFNPRHLLLVVVLTAIVVWASEQADTWFDIGYFDTMFGMVLGAFVPILCQHVGNILIFSFMRRNPGEIQGAVTVTMRYSILLSIAYALPVIAPIAIAAAYTRAPIVVGMLVGASVLMVARLSWFLRARKS